MGDIACLVYTRGGSRDVRLDPLAPGEHLSYMVWYLEIRESCGEDHDATPSRCSMGGEEGMAGGSPVISYVRLTPAQQLSKEVVIWKHLKHRNLLPLYGVTRTTGNEGPCFVSPWIEEANIRTFTRNNPTFNRFDLVSNPRLSCHVALTPSSWWTYVRVSLTCTQKAFSTAT